MKRHPSLAHLSRDHHGALLLARLLQGNAPPYKGLPQDTDGKAVYALEYYANELREHFEDEEKVFQRLKGINGSLDAMITAILREHAELHRLFGEVKAHPRPADHLDTVGRALEKHVRREERELFPLIEQVCSDDLLAEINTILSPLGDEKRYRK
jgi:hemerythrin-like domain-containing protein